MVEEPKPLLTVGEIRRRASALLRQPLELHNVEYVLRKRGIQPCGKAGQAWVYTEADLDYIVSVLKRMRSEQEGGRHV